MSRTPHPKHHNPESGKRSTLTKLLTFFSIIALASSGCGSKPASRADLKLTSTKGIAYTANLNGIQIQDNLSDLLGEIEPAIANQFLSGPAGHGLIKIKGMMQLYFTIGALRQTGEGSLSIGHFNLTSHKMGEKLSFEATYDATITLFAKEDRAELKKTFWLPVKMDKASVRSFIDSNPKCFSNEFDHARQEHQADYEQVAFYYFNLEQNGCDKRITTDGTLQRVEFVMVKSPENPKQEKFPEYKKIWNDNRLVATLFFTPAESLNKYDPGVEAANVFSRGLTASYGKPIEGDLMAPNTTGSHIEAYDREATFQLPGNRLLVARVKVRDGSWLQENSKAADEIRAAAQTSDFVSYNGHSGYGMNIESFESSISPATNQHLVFFANGCSSFAYIGRQIFKAEHSGSLIPKDLDLVANLNATYFHLFGQTNLMFIKNLVESKASYISILKGIQKLQGEQYDASVIIRGEEDNTQP